MNSEIPKIKRKVRQMRQWLDELYSTISQKDHHYATRSQQQLIMKIIRLKADAEKMLANWRVNQAHGRISKTCAD